MANNATRPLAILIVGDVRGFEDDLHARFGDGVVIHRVAGVDEIAGVLGQEQIDWVMFDPAVLGGSTLPTAEAIFDHVPHGNALVDLDGNFIWANPTMRSYPARLRDQVAALSREAFPWANSGNVDHSISHERGRRHRVEIDEKIFEVHFTPIVQSAEAPALVSAIVWDSTRIQRLQERINALDKAAEELVSLDSEQIEQLDVQQRLELLEKKVIRYTHELMHFDHFTVHLLDPVTNKLELVLSSGMPAAVSDIPLYAKPQGNGVTGYVASTGRSYLCMDIGTDDLYLPGCEGARSCLAVPLQMHDRVIGVFNVESRQLAAFSEDDRQFAVMFARQIAMALHILNLLVSERHSTTGQLAGDLAAEITSPLNDLLTEVGNLLDDYIGHDELRHRLNQISDNGVRIRDALREVMSPGRGILHRGRSTAAKTTARDPVLAGCRILVADDEEVIRETVCDVLHSYGCEVEPACDGQVAIDKLGTSAFDLVLSDIRMPHRNGYEVFAVAKDRDKDCPVILMTGFGYDPNHSIVRARREGLAAVLFKPFKVDQLIGEIRTAIRAKTKK